MINIMTRKTYIPKLNKIIIILLMLCLAFNMVFIGNTINSVGLDLADFDVWSASSGEKILQNIKYDTDKKGQAALFVNMAKNEYEAVQLIITAKSDISSYNLTVSDLTHENGTDKLLTDAIVVYSQKYIQTFDKSNTQYPVGFYPDALVPLDKIRQAKENKVKKGENQGLWIKFKTDKTAVAGNYTGSFMLDIDGSPKSISVVVKVWDFEISDEVHTKSSFLMYPGPLFQAEHDSTMDMQKAYYDFFLDYRISLMNLPSKMYAEDFLDTLEQYYTNPAVSAYNIPYVHNGYGNIDDRQLSDLIKKIVIKSVDQNVDFLKKAYIYNIYIDEYSDSAVRTQKAINWSKTFKTMIDDLLTFFDNEFGVDYLNDVEGLRHSLKNLTNLQVTKFMEGISNNTNYNSICPSFGEFHTQEQRDFLKQKFNNPDDEIWWYGCLGPIFPYPTYHIDDNLLSSRILSWMQYDYDIAGNLYYFVNLYSGDAGTYTFYPIDEWSLANRNLGGAKVNGDGWLVYPGEKYGIKGPLPSIRLESIRDGLEEYEYLHYFNELVLENADFFEASNLSAKKILSSTFNTIYSGVFTTTDTKTFLQARDSVARAILTLKGDEKMMLVDETSDIKTSTFTFYMSNDVEIGQLDTHTKLISSAAKGQGKQVVFEVDKENRIGDIYLNFSYNINGKTKAYSKFLESGTFVLAEFNDESFSKYVRVSADSTFELASVDDVDSFKFKMVSTSDPIKQLTFTPYFYLNAEFVNKIKSISFKHIYIILYNDSDEDIDLSIAEKNINFTTTIASTTLKSKSWTKVQISGFTNLQIMDSLRFVFKNKVKNGQAIDQIVYLSEVTYIV